MRSLGPIADHLRLAEIRGSRRPRRPLTDLDRRINAETGSPAHWTWDPCERCGEMISSHRSAVVMCWDCKQATIPRNVSGLPDHRAAAMESAHVPAMYSRHFDPTRCAIKIPDAWPAGCWCLLYSGPRGVGKTVAAVETAYRLWGAGWVFRTARDLARPEFRDELARDPGRHKVRSPWVVDDLGVGHNGGLWQTLAAVLFDRYDSIRPTILTTGLTVAQIAESSGDTSLIDRLKAGKLFIFRGASQRGKP